jgi:hypothetical protein
MAIMTAHRDSHAQAPRRSIHSPAPVIHRPCMTIYEFYCPDCHTVYSFFSSTIDTAASPTARAAGARAWGAGRRVSPPCAAAPRPKRARSRRRSATSTTSAWSERWPRWPTRWEVSAKATVPRTRAPSPACCASSATPPASRRGRGWKRCCAASKPARTPTRSRRRWARRRRSRRRGRLFGFLPGQESGQGGAQAEGRRDPLLLLSVRARAQERAAAARSAAARTMVTMAISPIDLPIDSSRPKIV